MTDLNPEDERLLKHAGKIVSVIAQWERENGAVAAIMPHEYADFCRRIAKAAITDAPRSAVDITTEQAATLLEADMRRYIYDVAPDRRIKCLERYRERLGLKPWADRDRP